MSSSEAHLAFHLTLQQSTNYVRLQLRTVLLAAWIWLLVTVAFLCTKLTTHLP